MRVILGPMEGVLDHLMREILTQINDYDLCVTEFVRVVNQILPNHVFYRLCPELKQQGKTRAGVPVHMQLLGQEPEWMAENAIRAAELGALGIDLNFGCPAKTVNKSKGGAAWNTRNGFTGWSNPSGKPYRPISRCPPKSGWAGKIPMTALTLSMRLKKQGRMS